MGGVDKTTGEAEASVSAWIAAFNARDLERLLAPLDAEVALHPLRLEGIEETYLGHGGVLQWTAELERRGYVHRIRLSEMRTVRDEAVLAAGDVALGGRVGDTPFCGVFEFAGPGIVSIHHYFCRPETLGRIGIID